MENNAQSDKEALARRAVVAIDALVNTAFERLRSERQKWDWASRSGWDQAKAAFDRISGLQSDYRRALDMFGWGHVATNGCLLALAREAWAAEPRLVDVDDDGDMLIGVRITARGRAWLFTGVAEDEALVVTLEAAHDPR